MKNGKSSESSGWEREGLKQIITEPNEKLLINIRELSVLTGIAAGTLYHWASQRRLPCIRLGARCLRFSLPAIREWLAELNEPANKRGL
jgi:excisionase family DNA binding protein